MKFATMKKLYAKTSFKSSKKSHKQAKEENAFGAADSAPATPNGSIILAYQSGTPHPADVKHKLSKHPFVANADDESSSMLLSPPAPHSAAPAPLQHSRSAYSLQQQQQPPQQQQQQQSDDLHYYYSIQELQNLNMLDHRHPHFHRQQQQLLQLQAEQQHQLQIPFYEHHKLVLQLPMADETPDTGTSPIYEAPQIVSNTLLPPSSVNNTNGSASSSFAASVDDDDDGVDFIADALVGFGSLPIVDAARAAHSMSTNTSASCFNSLRKLQHTHSMPSIHGGGGAAAAAVEGSARSSQLHYQPQSHPQRHNSVKANFISGPPSVAMHAEQSIIGARASVMVYDDNQKRWLPSGTSSGLSKVQIYHHQQNNTFRIVGRKLQDHEVVINCSILKGLKYNQATPTFHQWRDSKFVYGLNFSSQNDAEAFARAMVHALDVLSGRVANNPAVGGAVGPGGQPTNGNGYEEDMGYRTMTSEDAAILRQQQQITGQITPSAQTPTSQTNQNNIPQSPPTPQGHHRTSRNSLSAPPAPQPQQMSMPQQQQQQQQQQQPPYVGPTQNGLQQQQQQPQQQQQAQIPPAPGQTQYHTPQQQQPPAAHAVYGTQQMVNAGYQQQNQYQPSHFMLSNSNPNLNLHQYPQQPQPQGGTPQPPMPPPHQAQNGGIAAGGPIYVASSQSQPGIPTSASSNSVVYASQQQQQQQQVAALQNGSIPPAPPGAYAQLNGAHSQESAYSQVPKAPPMMAPSGGVPMPPPLNRISGGAVAPAAPPPPPTFGGAPAPPQPPAPPAPPAPPMMGPIGGGGPGIGAGAVGGSGAPPPPPPPPLGGGGPAAKKDDPQAELMGSLAAQLQQAKLKKNKSATATTENSGSSTSSGGSGSNYGTIGRSSTGMASMMDEMAKTLARRRAQAEKKEPDPEPEVKQRPWEKSNTLPHKLGSSSSSTSNCNANSNNTSNSGSESPRPMRKRFGSASEETILKQVNGDGLSLALSGSDLDTLKAEILREIRSEIQKVKQEIIDVIKSEFNRR